MVYARDAAPPWPSPPTTTATAAAATNRSLDGHATHTGARARHRRYSVKPYRLTCRRLYPSLSRPLPNQNGVRWGAACGSAFGNVYT